MKLHRFDVIDRRRPEDLPVVARVTVTIDPEGSRLPNGVEKAIVKALSALYVDDDVSVVHE